VGLIEIRARSQRRRAEPLRGCLGPKDADAGAVVIPISRIVHVVRPSDMIGEGPNSHHAYFCLALPLPLFHRPVSVLHPRERRSPAASSSCTGAFVRRARGGPRRGSGGSLGRPVGLTKQDQSSGDQRTPSPRPAYDPTRASPEQRTRGRHQSLAQGPTQHQANLTLVTSQHHIWRGGCSSLCAVCPRRMEIPSAVCLPTMRSRTADAP
jgi:hypothetical protein